MLLCSVFSIIPPLHTGHKVIQSNFNSFVNNGSQRFRFNFLAILHLEEVSQGHLCPRPVTIKPNTNGTEREHQLPNRSPGPPQSCCNETPSPKVSSWCKAQATQQPPPAETEPSWLRHRSAKWKGAINKVSEGVGPNRGFVSSSQTPAGTAPFTGQRNPYGWDLMAG